MHQNQKDILFKQATNRLSTIKKIMQTSLSKTIVNTKKLVETLPTVNADQKIVQQKLIKYGQKKSYEINELIPSPYFTTCLVQFEDGTKDELSFGKFSFSDQDIYSWVTPVSSIRFEKPGKVSYKKPDGTKRQGTLIKKDQYMITEGTIKYLSTESIDTERELVYQEYFSKQKKNFLLPEIVAQMEKAQDTVIRAHHKGPFLISGPAGSGKTTLALHRIAYLAQSPDISDIYKPKSILVFVQDQGACDYFSHLLPQLGINDVTITTFTKFAMEVLDIKDHNYTFRIGETQKEKDVYEFTKHEALQNISSHNLKKDIYKTLELIYDQFDHNQKQLFNKQKQNKQLDTFDLTMLLSLYVKKHKKIMITKEYYQMKKDRSATKKFGKFPVNYSLILFDEFQNYLPEQIKLAKTTLDQTYNSVMYVGDMAQQTQFGTIKNWQQANEDIKPTRQVGLQKVYRNTKNILLFINSLGYNVKIDNLIKPGSEVIQKILTTKQQEITYVQTLINNPDISIGILAKEKTYLDDFKKLSFGKNVHIMSINEAQGVEFDTVCIVGIDKEMFTVQYSESKYQKYIKEKKRIQKDLLYVALTRASNHLHVIGKCTLHETTLFN